MAGLVFTIEAQDKFSPTFQKAQTELQKTENVVNKTDSETKKFGLSINDLQGGVGGLVNKFSTLIPTIGLVVGGLTAVVKGLSECTRAAIEAETVQVRFATALSLANVPENLINSLSLYATELQAITGVSDETIKSAMALGSTMGISAVDMQKAITVALDLSAALGVDLNTAMRMLAKGTEGNIEQLKRYIPALGDMNLESKSTAELLEIVGQKVDGMAEKMGETAKGSANKLKEAFGDLKETIGNSFLPVIKETNEWLVKVINNINAMLTGQAKVKETGFLYNEQAANKLITAQQAKEMGLIQAQQENTQETNNNTKAKTENTLKIKETTQSFTALELAIKATSVAYEQVDEIIQQVKYNLKNQIDAYEETTEIIEQYKDYMHNTWKSAKEAGETTETSETEEEVNNLSSSFNYLALTSQALGVNLEAGFEGFLISLLQQTQAFQMLSQIFSPLIAMLDAMLVPLLQMLLPPIMAIYNAMKPIFDVLIVPLLTFGAIISNLIAGLTAFATLVMYIVTFQWGKISGIKWTGTSIEQLGASIEGAWAGIETVNTTSSTTATGAGASYTAAPTYHINVYVETAALVGDNGLDEFAMLIKQKIDFIVARGA